MTDVFIAAFVKDGVRVYDLMYRDFGSCVPGLSVIESENEILGELSQDLYDVLGLDDYEIFPSNQSLEILRNLSSSGIELPTRMDVFKLDALVRRWIEIRNLLKDVLPDL